MNTKTKHTPGPWVVMNGSLDVWNAEKTRRITAHPWVDKDDESEANARLIAAAPDLLTALEIALPYVESFDDDNADLQTKANAAAVCAAIAKAKGEKS